MAAHVYTVLYSLMQTLVRVWEYLKVYVYITDKYITFKFNQTLSRVCISLYKHRESIFY